MKTASRRTFLKRSVGTGPTLNAANTLGHKPQVEVEEKALTQPPGKVTVAPASINIYES